MLTFEQIKELVELVAERKLGVLEVERSGFRLRIDGKVDAPPPPAPAAAHSHHASLEAHSAPASGHGPAAAPAGGGSSSPAPAAAEPEGHPEGTHVLTSPIVGTFYRSPAPDSDAYVEVGSRVKTGQVLCIVEAMKLMNEIEADVDGVVLEVFPQNGQPVEFGEPLFAIRAD